METMETAAYIIVVALFVLGACLVIYGTIVKNRWGVNFRRLSCPNCGTQMAQVRAPSASVGSASRLGLVLHAAGLFDADSACAPSARSDGVPPMRGRDAASPSP